MFSKFKSFFSKDNSRKDLPLSDQFDHSQIPLNGAAQCPFMNKKSKPQAADPQACPVTGKKAPSTNSDSESEQEKPRGGCPFMGTSDKKKNPSLLLTEAGYDEPFVSKFKYYLSSSKLDFSSFKKGPLPAVSRQIFNNYPIYLQHTLFYNGQDYKKVRTLECCSRFMAYEQLREKGNKKFNKGKYYEALDFYERAMSLFRWLEYQEPLNLSKVTSENALALEQSFEESSESGSKVNIDLQEQKGRAEDASAAFDEMKTKYKEFFITYNDDNTKECDGEDMTQAADVDMRKSLLIQVYLNMCAAYIHTHHYTLAEKVCNDGLALSENVSQLYFRKAQALSLRKDCSAQQLQIALKCINTAIAKRSNQKIFSTANENILKMLNLHNSAEAYQTCLQHVEARIAQISAFNSSNYQKVYERTKQIHEIEQRIISEGKIPKQRNDTPMLYDTTEMRILDRMISKYVKVIEFYTEARNPEQINLAKKEFQEVLRIQSEVKGLFEVELKETQGELGGIETDKIKGRIAYVKTNFAENVYNSGRFNFTMLEWVIKQIVKEEAEERKKREEAEKMEAAEKMSMSEETTSKKGYKNLIYLLLLIPVLLILFNMYAL